MPRIAIIGSGFSGICLGIQLKQAGFDDLTILEKSDRLGGTWRDNTYPGAACDSPAFAYCFSFEQKTDWTRKWVPHDEILGYLEHCARSYGLLRQIRFGAEVESARFAEDEAAWHIRTSQGEELVADILVSGVGQLNRPYVPDITGLGSFAGECFHSARWNHGYDMAGERVAVIGNAASAIQLIPEVAKQAAELLVFQRSANWMLPRFDRAFSDEEKRRFARWPWLAKLYRWWIWASFESRWPVFKQNRFLARRIEALATKSMRAQISDPALQKALIPDYPIGGKRILISDDYYAALERKNVRVILEPIERVTPSGVETADSELHEVDAIVLATGFESTAFLAPMKLEGRDGRNLNEAWRDGAEAYLGISVAGFPNFFMMYGPNTNLGHNSIIFMIECQARYILDCVRTLAERRLRWIDVRADAMDAFNRKLRSELARTAWAKTDHSWYKNAAGRITNNWSGSTIRYWWETRRANLAVYDKQR